MNRTTTHRTPAFFLSPWGEVVELDTAELAELTSPDGSVRLACSDGEVVFERVVWR